MRNKKTQELVLLAILTALTLTLAFVHVPTPTGFVTLLDVGVFFTAFTWARKKEQLLADCQGF